MPLAKFAKLRALEHTLLFCAPRDLEPRPWRVMTQPKYHCVQKKVADNEGYSDRASVARWDRESRISVFREYLDTWTPPKGGAIDRESKNRWTSLRDGYPNSPSMSRKLQITILGTADFEARRS